MEKVGIQEIKALSGQSAEENCRDPVSRSKSHTMLWPRTKTLCRTAMKFPIVDDP
jgi:hypothetical protein